MLEGDLRNKVRSINPRRLFPFAEPAVWVSKQTFFFRRGKTIDSKKTYRDPKKTVQWLQNPLSITSTLPRRRWIIFSSGRGNVSLWSDCTPGPTFLLGQKCVSEIAGGAESVDHSWEVTINHTNPHPGAGLTTLLSFPLLSCCLHGRLVMFCCTFGKPQTRLITHWCFVRRVFFGL